MGADEVESDRTVWAAACVTTEERERISLGATTAGLTLSDFVRRAVRRASGLESPSVEMGCMAGLRAELDEAGRHSNLSTRAVNSAAARYARAMRIRGREVADLLGLARTAAGEAAESERTLGRCSAPLVELLSARVLLVEDGTGVRVPRVEQVRARVSPGEAEVVDSAGSLRGLRRSQMLRVLLLAESDIALGVPQTDLAIVTMREARLARNAWRRWQNNDSQSERSIARVLRKCSDSRWLGREYAAEVTRWLEEARASNSRASRTVSEVALALGRAGVPMG